jgi:hypothetical protein
MLTQRLGENMSGKVIAISLIGILSCVVSGQTANDFKKKYEAQDFFEVRPKILMKAEYNANGEMCSVFLQPNHYSIKEKTVFVGNSSIDLYDLLSIINELAPIETRKGKGSSLGYIGQGGMMSGGFTFDNIRINVKQILWPKRNLKADSIYPEEVVGKDASYNTELIKFLNSFGPPETASISWIKKDGCGE